jgi:hypothetical protein
MKGAPTRSDSTSTVDSADGSCMVEFNAMKRQLFKTKMCRHFLTGKCKYNTDCTFSHDRSELLVRKDMAKTKLCKKAHCTDLSCTYAHSIEEIRYATDDICPNLTHRGVCPGAPACPYSHNLTYLEELEVAIKVKSPDMQRAPSAHGRSPASSSGILTPTMTTEASANDLVQALIEMLTLAQGNAH